MRKINFILMNKIQGKRALNRYDISFFTNDILVG